MPREIIWEWLDSPHFRARIGKAFMADRWAEIEVPDRSRYGERYHLLMVRFTYGVDHGKWPNRSTKGSINISDTLTAMAIASDWLNHGIAPERNPQEPPP